MINQQQDCFLSTKTCVYDIQSAKRQLGDSVVSMIILLYAFTGSDTTSRILGVGRDKLLKLHEKIDRSISEEFYSQILQKNVLKKLERGYFDSYKYSFDSRNTR